MSANELRIVQGPSALGSDPRRFVALTRTLTLSDFKLKFYGSALGYLWQLVRPLRKLLTYRRPLRGARCRRGRSPSCSPISKAARGSGSSTARPCG